ncbi:hypothetical protein XU18_3427 [Perkinsela sp. CCAP 1560/4]|nr:hypothetical protein XU18_3427 [Perkinsela sp. CCAP 1560/4]|eukprot:KNH05456.1 hypothetical protein XU18_3427 [Perkinsela sp. CCAP 1560/4]
MKIWSSIFHNVFGVSYVRLPLMMTIPLVYKFYIDRSVDDWFMWFNEGTTQKDVWMRLEARAAEQANNNADADEEVAEEDA